MEKLLKYTLKQKFILFLSSLLLVSSIVLNCIADKNSFSDYPIDYQYINTKDIASSKIPLKNPPNSRSQSNNGKNVVTIASINPFTTTQSTPVVKELSMKGVSSTIQNNLQPEKNWYLPVEHGNISYPITYSHTALDITSSNGSMELIFPVANGIISSIYKDKNGANVVTVNHFINGVGYTSQYAHLAYIFSNIYVGKEVTINDSLGPMGRTGMATGIHLHISLVDCMIYDENGSCKDLGSYFRYMRQRYNEGFRGLYSVMEVPSSWNSR